MLKLPRTAKQLNAWIECTFLVLEGAKWAYLNFPYEIVLMGEKLEQNYRVSFVTLALKGPEDLCCEQIAVALRDAVSLSDLQDSAATLFIRTAFRYEEGYLNGRVAFFKAAYTQKLRQSFCYKAEGQVTSRAVLKED